MIGWIVGSAIVGSAATLAVLVAARGDRSPGKPEGKLRHDCTIAIWLLEVDRDDPVSVAVNETTGALGFSHAVLDICEEDAEGHALLVDAQLGEGVRRVRADRYDSRRRVRVYLSGDSAWELRGCARARVGTPFDVLGFLRPEENARGITCSHYLAQCMPPDLRQRVDLARRQEDRGAISPNQLARAFGVGSPHDSDVMI